MTVTIPNADSVLVQMLELFNEKLTSPYQIVTDDEEVPSPRLLEAMAEAEEMKNNPHLYKTYTDVGEMIRECLND